MKNGIAAGPSGAVSEIVKTAEEVGVDMIANLVNPINVGVIPAEGKLTTIVNGYNGKGDSLEIGNCRGLKLTE